MGNILDKPLTEKTTFVGSSTNAAIRPSAAATAPSCDADAARFAVSSMQGRRKTQEDAHVFETRLRPHPRKQEWGDPLPDHALFAVFDGHGTAFASKYAAKHFVGTLCRQQSFIEYCQKCVNNSQQETCNAAKGKRGKKKKGRTAASSTDPTARNSLFLANDDNGSLRALLKDALHNAFLELDAELLQEMSRRKENRDALGAAFCPGPADVEHLFDEFDSGTTAIVVLVTHQYIICANLGDSRAILRRGNNQQEKNEDDEADASTIRLSIDHKPDCEDEATRIRNAGGVLCSGKIGGSLAVSRALGDFAFKDEESVLCAGAAGNHPADNSCSIVRPEDQMVSPVPEIIVVDRNIAMDRFLFLACDGIWDVTSNEECVRMVETIFSEGENNLGLVCEEMLDQCCAKGSIDNMTAIIVKFPSQQIGIGGGVMKRRKQRDAVRVVEGQNLKYQGKSRWR